jgi:CheY-like chemotaxis protein
VAVLDDDQSFRELMAELLPAEGFRMVPLADGADPGDSLVAGAADALILDLRGLGSRSGFDTLLRLRTDTRLQGLPILICSADIRQLREHAARLAQIPHVAMLEKPFGVDALVGTLRGLLNGTPAFPAQGGTVDPEAAAVLETWLGRLGRTLRWAVTDAWVPDRQAGFLRCAASWAAAVQLEPFAVVSRRTRLPIGAGLPGRTWASGRSSWVEDLLADLNFPRLSIAREVRLVSAAAVPVFDRDELAGVVCGYDTRLRRPDVAALERLRRFVTDAGPILRRATGDSD